MTTDEPATTFETLVLGNNTVKLGELYDARKSQFLNVQMYSANLIDQYTTTTDIKFTELGLKMSNSREDKVNIIDINAQLSLEVLGGLVKAKGSAAYLNDTRANTHEKSWAMFLKQRLREERLAFAEDALGSNVLSYAQKNYIKTEQATHFVSSIVYGGRLIINLVAVTSKLSEKEKIEGALEAELQKLKGVVDLNAQASMAIKSQYNNLNNKFHVEVHGDIALTSVPVNPEDVLGIFPEACSLIGTGVPVFVTLQPIPRDLVDDAIFINQIEENLLMELLDTFSNLDDVRSRFEVLMSTSTSYKDFIPSLETDVKKASSYFRKEHRKLITNLAKCISELRSTGGSSAIANASSLITDATKLYDKHTEEQHYNSAPQYPSKLAGLEGALADFEFFITVVENDGLHLTAIKDFILALAKHSKVVIVPMPPLFTDADNNLRRLSSLAPAAHIAYSNQNPQIPVFCLYFEGQDMLDHFLNDGKVIQLFRPEIYVGTKSSDGTLTWKLETVSKVLALMPKTLYHFALDFVVDAFHKTTNIYVLKALDKLDSAQSFSVNISGWAMKNYCGHDSPFLVLSDSDGKQQIIFLRMNLTFEILVRVSETKWFMMSRDITAKLTDNGDFSLTFVQNIETSKWIFYFNGKEISNQPIGKANFGKLSLSICKLDGKKEESFSGGIYDVSIYSSALTEVELHIALSRSTLKSADTTKFTQVKEAFACVERSEVCDAAP